MEKSWPTQRTNQPPLFLPYIKVWLRRVTAWYDVYWQRIISVVWMGYQLPCRGTILGLCHGAPAASTFFIVRMPSHLRQFTWQQINVSERWRVRVILSSLLHTGWKAWLGGCSLPRGSAVRLVAVQRRINLNAEQRQQCTSLFRHTHTHTTQINKTNCIWEKKRTRLTLCAG